MGNDELPKDDEEFIEIPDKCIVKIKSMPEYVTMQQKDEEQDTDITKNPQQRKDKKKGPKHKHVKRKATKEDKVEEVRKQLVEEMFGPYIETGNFKEIWKRVILASTNETVKDINDMILDKLRAKGHILTTHFGVDTVDEGDPYENYMEYPPEWLHTLHTTGLAPYELRLTKGCPVMLLRNLNQAVLLSNGTRLIVEHIYKHVLVCKYLNGPREGEIVWIPNLKLDSGNEFPFKLTRKQFPVKPCFAMTINKSQGQTLDYVGLDMTTPVFSHGQCYVAFSRARGWDSIRVAVDPEKKNKVKNVVWKEVLFEDEKE